MEVDDVVNIAVFYDGSWVRKDDGFWEFQNYHSTIIGINKRCTFEELEDDIYRLLRIDRNEQYLKMSFLYVACFQPFHPKHVEGDKDVKCFLREIRDRVPKTPLYVEVFSRVPQFEQADREFPVHCGAFNSDGGSNHLSSTCPSSQRSQFRDRLRLENGKYRTNVDANICRLSNTQHSKT